MKQNPSPKKICENVDAIAYENAKASHLLVQTEFSIAIESRREKTLLFAKMRKQRHS